MHGLHAVGVCGVAGSGTVGVCGELGEHDAIAWAFALGGDVVRASVGFAFGGFGSGKVRGAAWAGEGDE